MGQELLARTVSAKRPSNRMQWCIFSSLDCLLRWSDPRGGSGYGPSYRKSRGVFMFGPDAARTQNVQIHRSRLSAVVLNLFYMHQCVLLFEMQADGILFSQREEEHS